MTAGAVTPSHVYPIGTRVNERGHLELGGCDALDLAREFGTPAFVVVEHDLRSRARAFVEAMGAMHENFEVLFGSKAFPCTAVYRVLREEGLGCDVASGGELYLALQAGFHPRRIYLHGNAKSEAELRQAVAAGVGHVVVDSFDDLERTLAVAGKLSRAGIAAGPQKVLIRVTPGIAGETHRAISTGQADSKFGFSLPEAPEAIEQARSAPELEVAGIHCHIGSQLFDLEPFREAIRAISALGEFPVYNLGGGLGAAYLRAQHPPGIRQYAEAIVDAALRWLGADKRLLIEPGRALVANTTVTLYTVQTVKRNLSTWVAVDGGMSDNLRPMLYDAAYEALVANRPLAPAAQRCNLVGKHCESGDVLVRGVELADPRAGDVIAVPATGAYGFALANNYNSVPRPPVIFCREGAARAVVRRESYEDLSARDLS